MAPKRPSRQKKADTLLHGNLTRNEVLIDYALGPFDKAAAAMDEKWGIDRLPDLVSTETAVKYGSAIEKLNAAIRENDLDLVKHRAEVCIRGFTAMDAEATARGAAKSDPRIIEINYEGWKIGIIPDIFDWKAAKNNRPDLEIFTVREVAVAMSYLRKNGGLIEAAKSAFPGAEISSIKSRETIRADESLDDEIPF